MNTVALGGRVYGVETFATKNGGKMSKFRLQVARYKKDAMYMDVVAFDKNADFVEQFVKEGSGVSISGKLDLEQWQKDGEEKKNYRWKVLADRVEFLPSNKKPEDKDGEPSKPAEVIVPEEILF